MRLRSNEVALRNGASIAESLKRNTELLAEKNALQAFSRAECVTEEDKKERQELMRLVRQSHLKRMRETLSDTQNVSSVTEPSTKPSLEESLIIPSSQSNVPKINLESPPCLQNSLPSTPTLIIPQNVLPPLPPMPPTLPRMDRAD